MFVIISATVVMGLSLQLIQNSSHSYAFASPQSLENITITAIFNQFGTKGMGKSLLDSAADKLRSNHPDLGINIKYIETGTDNNNTRYQILNAITNHTSVDIVSLDQIWLGEFAQKGLLTDLTDYTKKWGRQNDWYQVSWDGGAYNNYLWMLGGDIVQLKEGHPTNGGYWFPTYNSTEGVRALQFIKDQVNAGIKPQKEHSFGEEFVNRSFAVMIEGSWMSSDLPK